MTLAVNDVRSNPNEQIFHAANVLKRSVRLRTVFEAIYKGGTKPKSVQQLMKATGFNQIAILQLGRRLADEQLVHKEKSGSTTTYGKDRYLAANRTKIMRIAKDPKKLKSLPTKYTATGSARELARQIWTVR